MLKLVRKAKTLTDRTKMALRALWDANHAVLSYSQYGEDMILRAIFARYPSVYHGFYIDVGAHHPKRFSNTCYFYERGWRGICIDPVPGGTYRFARHRPRDIFLDVGIAKNEGEMTYYIYDEPALNTFSRAIVEKSSHKVLRTQKIKTLPLSRVLDEWLPRGQVIDFLSVDTEGFETDVLSSNDWNRYRPRVVVVEEMSIQSFSDIVDLGIEHLMRRHGYQAVSRIPSGLIYVDATSLIYDGGAYLNYSWNENAFTRRP